MQIVKNETADKFFSPNVMNVGEGKHNAVGKCVRRWLLLASCRPRRKHPMQVKNVQTISFVQM
jgi:hypothetical protein